MMCMFANMHVKISVLLWSIISNQLVPVPLKGLDKAASPTFWSFSRLLVKSFFVFFQYSSDFGCVLSQMSGLHSLADYNWNPPPPPPVLCFSDQHRHHLFWLLSNGSFCYKN